MQVHFELQLFQLFASSTFQLPMTLLSPLHFERDLNKSCSMSIKIIHYRQGSRTSVFTDETVTMTWDITAVIYQVSFYVPNFHVFQVKYYFFLFFFFFFYRHCYGKTILYPDKTNMVLFCKTNIWPHFCFSTHFLELNILNS